MQVLKTKVVEWSVNPVFNETFRFEVLVSLIFLFHQKTCFKMTEDEVRTKTLVLQVFDWDLITGDDDIGEVYLAFISHNSST